MVLGLGQAVREAALEGARTEARDAIKEVLLSNLRPEDLAGPMAGERLAQVDRFVRKVRVKIWNRQGQVVYSDDLSQVGARYPVHP